MLPLLESIFMFRDGVRNNDSKTIQTARSIFRPVWFGRHHTKYLLVDFFDSCCREIMPPEITNLIENNESVSANGRRDAHQGLDFILEEFNKNIKKHITGIANSEKWEKVIRNYDALCDLRSNICSVLSLKFDETSPRQIVPFHTEQEEFRKVIRKSGFLIPKLKREIESIDSSVTMTKDAEKFLDSSIEIANKITQIFKDTLSFPSKLNFSKLPLTAAEELQSSKDENKTNKELYSILDELVSLLPQERQKELSQTKRKIKNAKKSVLIEFLNDLRNEFSE